MSKRFRYAVVGCGLMGSAAARHLANLRDGVALIGPAEPKERKSHHGVFASHYDEGRITRTIDPDPVWAELARRSIGRYRDIEAATGISFFSDVGSLLTGVGQAEGKAYVERIEAAAQASQVEAQALGPDDLQRRFPWFSFPEGTTGVHEQSGAGYISPRRLVRAQAMLAERAGAERIEATVRSIRTDGGRVVIETADGAEIHAERALVAAGGFSIQKNLLPQPVELTVYGRTVVFFEVSAADAQALSNMPSMIHKAEADRDDIYMLPPIRYPDGRFYLKIGGDPDDLVLRSDMLGDWFRGEGRPHVRDHLVARMSSLVPGLDVLSVSTAPCVTNFTPSGYPAIGWLEGGLVAVVTGGCGAAAKSSDEIGRLGAELVHEGRISSLDFDFSPVKRA